MKIRLILLALSVTGALAEESAPFAIHAARVGDAPIVTEDMLAGPDGESINGPTLIRVPDWVKNPLGRYYLYFAHHAGKYLRLAYFSFVGHRPERILATRVDLKGPPAAWRARGVVEVLKPERDWEGARYPLAYSNGGISRTRVNELRDPGVFREGGAAWLLYATAGEHGLGLARRDYPETLP